MTISTPATTAVSSISGIKVKNTKNNIGPDTRICMMVVAPAKRGKTTFGKTLDDLTKKHFGKPTLFIALEPSEGGGTMSIQDFDVDYVTPKTYEEYNKIIAWLAGDPTYGGVVLDSSYEFVGRFLKPYALKFPYERGSAPASRVAGVPGQSDYHTMGEEGRMVFNKLIGLTADENPNLRKHLLVTALEKDKTNRDGELIYTGPDLPGSLATVATSMFQTVAGIDFKTTVVPDPIDSKKTTRVTERIIATDASIPANMKRIIGDRTRCIPQGAPLDLVQIYEQFWMPRWKS